MCTLPKSHFLDIFQKPTFLYTGQCDKTKLITDWSGHIKSPDFPGYTAGLNCKWHFRVSQGNLLEVSFTDFMVYLFRLTFFLDLDFESGQLVYLLSVEKTLLFKTR